LYFASRCASAPLRQFDSGHPALPRQDCCLKPLGHLSVFLSEPSTSLRSRWGPGLRRGDGAVFAGPARLRGW